MPPLPVIANCYRVTINGSPVAGVTPHNVMHFLAASDDVDEVGGALVAAFEDADNFWSPVPGGFEPASFDILPLDGTSTTVTEGFSPSWCEGSGEFIPEAACVLSLKTARRGPRGRGRLYIGPLGEANCENGQLVGDAKAHIEAAMATLVADLGSESIGFAVASYVHADAHPVTSYVVQTALATQRRRLLQQRA